MVYRNITFYISHIFNSQISLLSIFDILHSIQPIDFNLIIFILISLLKAVKALLLIIISAELLFLSIYLIFIILQYLYN